MLQKLLFLGLAIAKGEQCLSDAIPSWQRKDVENAGEHYDVGVWVNDWPAGHIVSRMAITIIKEKLGYNVTEGLGGGTQDMIYAMTGCEDPTNITDRGCRGKVSRFHVALEGWIEDYPQLWQQIQADYSETAPRRLGSMGYDGRTSVYVPRPIVEEAYFSKGLSLGYYRSYNASWNKPEDYFDPISSVDRSKVMPCAKTRLTISSIMKGYVDITGDLDGVVISGDEYTAKCPDGYFWIPPACRAQHDKCFPFFTGGTGWDIEGYLQKATAWNMPMAIAVAGSWSDYLALPLQVKSLFYWWQPDPSFLQLRPEEVMFPTFNRLKWFKGDRTSASPDIPIEKVVSNDLARLAGLVEVFISNLRIEMTSLNEIMQDQLDSNDDYETVTCRWLRANEDLWKEWLPDATNCFPGFGLFDPVSGTYVQDREDRTGKTCQPCPSGTFSSQLVDPAGVTYVCLQCPIGTSQKSGASLACEQCREGEFQDFIGSRSCKLCGIAEYQDERGQDRCKSCQNESTTLGIGSTSLLDCGCQRGHIDTSPVAGELICSECSEGLDCPVLSSLQSLETGRAKSKSSDLDLGADLVPQVKVGYRTSREDPTGVFRCQQLAHCPGGLPGVCAGGRIGLACGACPAHQTWLEDSCKDCGVQRNLWVMVFAVVVLGLFVAPKMLIPGKVTTAKATATFTAASAVGLVVHNVQVIGVVGTLNVEWPEQLRDFLRLCQVLILEEESSGVACIRGSLGSAPYIASTLIFPAAVAWLCTSYFIARLLPAKLRWDFPKTLNAIGFFLQASFTMMSTMALAPFMCYGHPNGKVSLLKHPNILCSSEEHTAMVLAGLALLAECCIFLAICTYLVIRAPQKIAQGSNVHLTSARFLFFRFRPDRWWYGLPVLVKGLALSMPLVAATDDPQLQAFLSVLVLEIFFGGMTLMWPWKIPIVNLMDCQASACMCLVAVAAFFYTDVRTLATSSLGFANSFVIAVISYGGFVLLSGTMIAFAAFSLQVVLRRKDARLERLINLRKTPVLSHFVNDLQRICAAVSVEEKALNRLDGLVFNDLKLIMDCIALVEAELVPRKSGGRSSYFALYAQARGTSSKGSMDHMDHDDHLADVPLDREELDLKPAV